MKFELHQYSDWIRSVGAYCFTEKGCCCPQLHVSSEQKDILEINYYENKPILWRLFNRAVNNNYLRYSKKHIMHFKISNNEAQTFVSNTSNVIDYVKIQHYLISAHF